MRRILFFLFIMISCKSEPGKAVVDLRPDWVQDFIVVDDPSQMDFGDLVNLVDSLACDSLAVQFNVTQEESARTYLLSPLGRCMEGMGCILIKPRNYFVLSIDTLHALFLSGSLDSVLLRHILNPDQSYLHASHPRKSIVVIVAPEETPCSALFKELEKLAISYQKIHWKFSTEVPFLAFRLAVFWPEPIERIE